MLDPIDSIRSAMDQLRDLPPAPFWASCALLERDRAVKFTHAGREFVGAHPAFWGRVQEQTIPGVLSSLAAIRIIDIDADREARREFMDAMAVAMSAGCEQHP